MQDTSQLTCPSSPEIIGYNGTLTINENENLTLSISDFEITDLDADLIDDTTFTLHIEDGDNYTVVDNTITPTLDYHVFDWMSRP